MKRYQVGSKEEGLLLNYLAAVLRLSKKKAKALLDSRQVFVNGQRLWMAKAKLWEGDQVEVNLPLDEVRVDPKSVLYSDDQLLVANKPAGIETNGPASLETELREALSQPALLAVHRLDRDTTGCVLFARSAKIKESLEELFRSGAVTKRYEAIVYGLFPKNVSEIRKPIGGKSAYTRVLVLDANKLGSHLRLEILTGRTHQIRKHMLAARHPVVGEKLYVHSALGHDYFRSVRRQMLHAKQISFISPFSNKHIDVIAALPGDFIACLKHLKLR
jgi:23S rRNA pseudouridine1911/1915/1917 synthase